MIFLTHQLSQSVEFPPFVRNDPHWWPIDARIEHAYCILTSIYASIIGLMKFYCKVFAEIASEAGFHELLQNFVGQQASDVVFCVKTVVKLKFANTMSDWTPLFNSKAMQKLGMKPVTGIVRVTIKKVCSVYLLRAWYACII